MSPEGFLSNFLLRAAIHLLWTLLVLSEVVVSFLGLARQIIAFGRNKKLWLSVIRKVWREEAKYRRLDVEKNDASRSFKKSLIVKFAKLFCGARFGKIFARTVVRSVVIVEIFCMSSDCHIFRQKLKWEIFLPKTLKNYQFPINLGIIITHY